MPERFRLLEKIAFSFVCFVTLMGTAFFAYGSSPGVRGGVQVGKELIIKSGQYSYACATTAHDPCAQFPIQ
ncbi:MAG TPA: hypothetical protein VL689_01355 [Paraburkholderia sp.]|jgi:hypothetical protein|nr:hypothetical protein [Paraburkholderia sp.]